MSAKAMDILHQLVKEVAKSDYKKLSSKIEAMTFERAFKELDGYHLQDNISTCKGEFLCSSLMFDFNFGHLNGTIFEDSNGMCEIYELFDFWMDDISSPIATMSISYDGNVEVDMWKLEV